MGDLQRKQMSRKHGLGEIDDGREKRVLLKDDADPKCDAVQHPVVPGPGLAAAGAYHRARPRAEATRLCV